MKSHKEFTIFHLSISDLHLFIFQSWIYDISFFKKYVKISKGFITLYCMNGEALSKCVVYM